MARPGRPGTRPWLPRSKRARTRNRDEPHEDTAQRSEYEVKRPGSIAAGYNWDSVSRTRPSQAPPSRGLGTVLSAAPAPSASQAPCLAGTCPEHPPLSESGVSSWHSARLASMSRSPCAQSSLVGRLGPAPAGPGRNCQWHAKLSGTRHLGLHQRAYLREPRPARPRRSAHRAPAAACVTATRRPTAPRRRAASPP